MTFEKACNAVRLYVEEMPHDSGDEWLNRLDECLAGIRAELCSAAQDDDHWSRYIDMTDESKTR